MKYIPKRTARKPAMSYPQLRKKALNVSVRASEFPRKTGRDFIHPLSPLALKNRLGTSQASR